MMGAPLLLFQLTGNMQLEFDDFEEIEEHPMAAPVLATFAQLFEGVLEQSPSDVASKTLNFDSIETED